MACFTREAASQEKNPTNLQLAVKAAKRGLIISVNRWRVFVLRRILSGFSVMRTVMGEYGGGAEKSSDTSPAKWYYACMQVALNVCVHAGSFLYMY